MDSQTTAIIFYVVIGIISIYIIYEIIGYFRGDSSVPLESTQIMMGGYKKWRKEIRKIIKK